MESASNGQRCALRSSKWTNKFNKKCTELTSSVSKVGIYRSNERLLTVSLYSSIKRWFALIDFIWTLYLASHSARLPTSVYTLFSVQAAAPNWPKNFFGELFLAKSVSAFERAPIVDARRSNCAVESKQSNVYYKVYYKTKQSLGRAMLQYDCTVTVARNCGWIADMYAWWYAPYSDRSPQRVKPFNQSIHSGHACKQADDVQVVAF